MLRDTSQRAPVDLTDAQLKELAAGKNVRLGEPKRPRALTDKDIEALRKGNKVDIDQVPELEPIVS